MRQQNQDLGLAELRHARNQNAHLLAAVFFFSIFFNLLILTGPLFMLQVYDRVLGSRSEETLVALLVLVAALYALMAVLDFARARIMARFANSFRIDLDARSFQASLDVAQGQENAKELRNGMRDLENLYNIFQSPTILAFFDAPWTPIFLLAIFVFHPLMGWVALLGGGLLILFSLFNGRLLKKRLRASQEQSAYAQKLLDESLSGNELIKAQGMQVNMATRFLEAKDKAASEFARANDRAGFFTAGSKAFRLFLQSLILAVGAWLILRGQLAPGAMIAGSILLGRALAPIETLVTQWNTVQSALLSWRSLGQLLDSVQIEPEKKKLPKPEVKLEMRAASYFARPGNIPILRNISFTLGAGQALGVIGRSGSGKSSLARLVLGVVPPISGEVRLGGAKLDQYASDDLGHYFGYLPQTVTLFSGSIFENIARFEENTDKEAVFKAAQLAHVHELILSLPDGYNTQIDNNVQQLSGGQKQRIALARALYGDPLFLVLDEPNSALDSEGSDALNAAIRNFKSAGRAVLVMTHRPQAIAECDNLLILEGGMTKAYGPRNEILESMTKNAANIQTTIKQAAK